MLITEEYRRVLTHEHATTKWGVIGVKHAPRIDAIMREQGFHSLLDYGSGQGLLARWFARDMLKIRLQEYEPGIPELAHMPEPAEIVVCLDVMEHVEPDCVVNVLDHIQALAHCMVYFHISTRPASRTLCDGRNAHLTVQPDQWWLALLRSRWNQLEYTQEWSSFTWIGSAYS